MSEKSRIALDFQEPRAARRPVLNQDRNNMNVEKCATIRENLEIESGVLGNNSNDY